MEPSDVLDLVSGASWGISPSLFDHVKLPGCRSHLGSVAETGGVTQTSGETGTSHVSQSVQGKSGRKDLDFHHAQLHSHYSQAGHSRVKVTQTRRRADAQTLLIMCTLHRHQPLILHSSMCFTRLSMGVDHIHGAPSASQSSISR